MLVYSISVIPDCVTVNGIEGVSNSTSGGLGAAAWSMGRVTKPHRRPKEQSRLTVPISPAVFYQFQNTYCFEMRRTSACQCGKDGNLHQIEVQHQDNRKRSLQYRAFQPVKCPTITCAPDYYAPSRIPMFQYGLSILYLFNRCNQMRFSKLDQVLEL